MGAAAGRAAGAATATVSAFFPEHSEVPGRARGGGAHGAAPGATYARWWRVWRRWQWRRRGRWQTGAADRGAMAAAAAAAADRRHDDGLAAGVPEQRPAAQPNASNQRVLKKRCMVWLLEANLSSQGMLDVVVPQTALPSTRLPHFCCNEVGRHTRVPCVAQR